MRLRIAALTLVFGLGIVGIVSAEEAGNWFTRLLAPSAEKSQRGAPAKTFAQSDVPTMPPASFKRVKQAKADLERRQEVCFKLKDIALAAGDEEMLRKVEQLEQRAYDLYFAATNLRGESVGETSVKKGGR